MPKCSNPECRKDVGQTRAKRITVPAPDQFSLPLSAVLLTCPRCDTVISAVALPERRKE